MTRKHFEQLAKALKDRQPQFDEFGNTCPLVRAGWFGAVSAVVSVAEANNPRFNRKKFYTACGINVDNYKPKT